jgi:hypothetical protein
LCGLTGGLAVKFVLDNIEEQSGDMAVEHCGDLDSGSQARVIRRCPAQPDHYVLDYGGRHILSSTAKDLIKAIDSTTGRPQLREKRGACDPVY